MNPQHSQRSRLWSRLARGVAFVLAVTLVASLGYATWEYTTWRNKMIEWDYGTIERLCGGDTGEDRLLEIRFVKQWEYKALKRTPDGDKVWLHWKLSKRHCGNWMLVDKPKGFVIRPFEIRFPNGAPHRQAVSCLGIPIDENEKYKRRDEFMEALRRLSSPPRNCLAD
jgi:hypothetical protein